jgi:electron transfer flavoprotein beta subunit
MRILVCVKRVPAPGARISLNDDGQSIDAKNLGFTTSPHEECAVEAAVHIAAEVGGSSTVLTMGPPEAEEQLRYAISVGVGSAVLVETDGSDLDPQATAGGLTTAISHLEERDGHFDLILFGNESADSGGYQVGIRVARGLDRPIVSGIKRIEVDGNSVVAHREIPSGFEVYRLPLPAVLAVREGLNLPRYPTLPGRLKSRKAEIDTLEAAAIAGGQRKIRLEAPPEQASQTITLGHGVDAVPAIIEVLELLELR